VHNIAASLRSQSAAPELRPHGLEVEGAWRFGLHQLLAVLAGTAATVRHELRLFV
jgi:hypothetical protein